ncbi:MAG: HD domain-containing protein [Anaerolineae bacterium]|nr:HD domain-containing protein [Anaerolineae bacterium]
MAIRLADAEGADRVIVEWAALLHDLDDWKFAGGDELAGARAARAFLLERGAEAALAEAVADIVQRVSFKGAGVPDNMPTLEGQVVQDADRLDALGAVGIARVFAYGGHVGSPLHDPTEAPRLHTSFADYKQKRGSSIAHFYEKLLLLRDRMHTATARQIAAERHVFMETYLERFFQEWEGRA